MSEDQTSPVNASTLQSSYGMNTTQCWKTIASQFIRVDNDRFHCELCIAHSSATLFYANRHFEQAHGNHSLQVGGEFIFICKRGCKKLGHYHCYRCKKIFPKKTLLQKHVNVCAFSTEPTSSSQFLLPPGNSELKSESESVEAISDIYIVSNLSLPVLSSPKDLQDVEAESDAVSNLASPLVPVFLSDDQSAYSVECDITANNESGNHSLSVLSPLSSNNKEDKVQCDQCEAKPMYRRNLKVHIQRKHTSEQKFFNETHNGVCVDRLNGIYLVSENRNGVQYPIHVQKLLRGNDPKIHCDSSKCRADKMIDGVSGNPSFECSHLLSIPSFVSTNPEIILEQAILDKLVEEGRLEEDTAQSLLTRKRVSESEGVNLVGAMTPELCSERYVFLSVYGFGERRYAFIDRYLVSFDKKEFKLVCHCQHGGTCEHKSIAKWYLRTAFPGVFLNESNQRITTVSLNIEHEVTVEHEFNNFKLDSTLRAPAESFQQLIIAPSEIECCRANCSGSLALHQSNENVKLLTRDGYVIIHKVWTKICQECQTVVNYCGVVDGIFNFNNKFFMSVALLLWLRVGIRQHIAVSKTICTVETLYDCHVDHNLVRRTFYKFLALFDEDVNFHCFICGYHPVIITFDVTRKVAFKLRDMVEDDGNHCEQVNAKEFWANLSKFIISVDSDRSIRPSVDNWAPFLPESSRRGDMLFNTEALKGVQGNDEQEFLECLSEERLEGILDIADIKMLKELCVECGIDAGQAAKASRIKCIEMLIKAMKDHSNIDKFFCKPWHSSGGLLTGSCPHGIVYCLKFLLKPESARDYGDMILNFKYPPSIIISDIPHMVAAHVNKREQQDFFNPYCGRVVEPSDCNIQRANDLSVSISWLDKRSEAAITDLKLDGSGIHPITLTTQHLSLYDKFHEGNTKQKKEFLRRTGQVKELAGINSETAEQTNSFLKNSLSYVDCMSPVHHLLVVKAMLSQKNLEVNKKILGKRKPIFDIYGRLTNSRLDATKRKIIPSDQVVQPINAKSANGIDFLIFPAASDIGKVSVPASVPVSVPPSVIHESNAYASRNRVHHVVSDHCGSPAKIMKLSDKPGDKFLTQLNQGIYNIQNNCWFSAVMVAIRNTLGSGRLYEDLLFNLWQSYQSEEDAYTSSDLKPVLESLSISSSWAFLDKDRLRSCLRHFTEIGSHQDPLDFFNLSTSLLDSIGEDKSIYLIKALQRRACVHCGAHSSIPVNHQCLSLPLDLTKPVADVEHLLSLYFAGEMVKYTCETCKKSASSIGIQMTNTPAVLCLNLVRCLLDNRKIRSVVKVNKLLKMQEYMVNAHGEGETTYILRAVIKHIGSSGESGHYTTILMEQDRPVLVNDHKTCISDTGFDQDAWMLIYEHLPTYNAMLTRWFPLTVGLLALVMCDQNIDTTLVQCGRQIWELLGLPDDEMSGLLKVLAGKVGRMFSELDQERGDVLSLLKKVLLCNQPQSKFMSYFAANCICTKCGNTSTPIRDFQIVQCSMNMQAIYEVVSDALCEEDCSNCSRSGMIIIGNPSIVSSILILECEDISCGHLINNFDDDKFYTDFTVLGAFSSDGSKALLHKDGVWYASHGSTLKKIEINDISGEMYVLLKGKDLPRERKINFTRKEVKQPMETNHLHKSHRNLLEGCLINLCDQDELEMMEALLVDGVINENNQHRIFPNAIVHQFKSLNEFVAISACAVGSMMTQRIGEFVIFNFPLSMVMVREKDEIVEVFFLGESIDVKDHVISACDRRSPLISKYDVIHISFEAIKQLHLYGLACSVTQSKPLMIEGDVAAALTSYILKIPEIDDSGFLVYLQSRCIFAHTLKMSLCEYQPHYAVANNGDLFCVDFNSPNVVAEIKQKYNDLSCTNLRDEVLVGLLEFVQSHPDLVRQYYFMHPSEDNNRVIHLMKQAMYKKLQCRLFYEQSHREKMLQLFPAMQYYGMLSILYIITKERNIGGDSNDLTTWKNGFIDNRTQAYQTFRMDEFIEYFVLKPVLIGYVCETSDLSREYVLSQTGCVGEEL